MKFAARAAQLQFNKIISTNLTPKNSIHEQSWAKYNINKFDKSVEFSSSQCTIYQEAYRNTAWPLKSKPSSTKNYVCSRCSRDTKCPRKFLIENLMIPSPTVSHMSYSTRFDASQVEEMLIARTLPFMRVYDIKPVGKEDTRVIVLTCHKM